MGKDWAISHCFCARALTKDDSGLASPHSAHAEAAPPAIIISQQQQSDDAGEFNGAL
jgi:hypothetical protein